MSEVVSLGWSIETITISDVNIWRVVKKVKLKAMAHIPHVIVKIDEFYLIWDIISKVKA